MRSTCILFVVGFPTRRYLSFQLKHVLFVKLLVLEEGSLEMLVISVSSS